MCGISGFVGVKNPTDRLQLVYFLGCGIDKRGRDAAGYVSVASGRVRVAKKPGLWADAKMRFLENAAKGEVCMAHARYATCGKAKQTNAHDDIVREAHPFVVKREGKPTIYGAHNGVLWDGFETAKKHGYKIRVDSEIIFELLADDRVDILNQIDGYGVVSWIYGDKPDEIKLCRLSTSSDLYAVRLEEGGIVYGSTKTIVDSAVDDSGLHIRNSFKVDKVGTVYLVREDGIYESTVTNVKLADYEGYGSYGNWGSNYVRTGRVGYRSFNFGKPSTHSQNARVGSNQLGWSEYTADWSDEWDEYIKEMEKKEDTDPGNTLDSIIDECQALKCDQCAREVDEDEIEQNCYMLENVYGKKDVPILCSECLWDVDLAKTSGLSVG